MKHYAREKWFELDDIKYWKCYGGKAEARAATKHIYRQRERAALKRATADLVDDELYTHDDSRYWERRMDDAALDWRELEAAECRLRESGAWDDEHTKLFAAAYREVRFRADAAYAEWLAA